MNTDGVVDTLLGSWEEGRWFEPTTGKICNNGKEYLDFNVIS